MRRMSGVHHDGTMLPQVSIRESLQIVDIDKAIAPSLNDRQGPAALLYLLDLGDPPTGKPIFHHPVSRAPVSPGYHSRQTRSPVQPMTEHGASIGNNGVFIEFPGPRQIHHRR